MNKKTLKMPQAFLALNNSRLKHKKLESKKTYFLDDCEFQIELSNPCNEKIAVEIDLGGNPNKLILSPGELVFLERHLDSNKKFKFRIFNTTESIDSSVISNNGNISFNYYKEMKLEKPVNNEPVIIEKRIIIDRNHYPWWNYDYYRTPDWTWRPYIIYTNDTQNSTEKNSDKLNIKRKGKLQKNTLNNFNMNNSVLYSSNLNSLDELNQSGTVEEGNKSEQKLIETKFQTLSIPFHSEEIKILPISMMEEYLKNPVYYCANCGSKHKKGDKFCSKCGDRL